MKVLIQNIKKLIAEDKVKDAIELLLTQKDLFRSSNDFFNVLLNNLMALENANINGLITDSDYKVEKNKILFKLLKKLDRLDKNRKYYNYERKIKWISLFIFLFSVIVIFFFLGFFDLKQNEINPNLDYQVGIVSIDDHTNINVEESLISRLDKFVIYKSYPIEIVKATDIGKKEITHKVASELGISREWELVIWGNAYPFGDISDSNFVNLRYQSLILEFLRSDLSNSNHIISFEYDIHKGKITGGIEEVIEKTMNLLVVRQLMSDSKESIEFINQQLASYPDSIDIFYLSLRASIYLIEDSLEQAILDYEKILDRDSTNSLALNNLGGIKYYKGQIEESVICLIEASNNNEFESDVIRKNLAYLIEQYPKMYQKNKNIEDNISLQVDKNRKEKKNQITNDKSSKESNDVQEKQDENAKEERGAYSPPLDSLNLYYYRKATIVIGVCIDKSGKVISSDFTQKGSSVMNQDLINRSIVYAKMYKFDTSTYDKQCGTITFDFGPDK